MRVMDWMDLAQYRDRWWALYAVIKPSVSIKSEEFLD
jgi:hypothetical protein